MWHNRPPQLPPHDPPSPPRQNKVVLQREYREKEGECFNELRGVIKDLTGQELRTRQEILRKAIDMLSTPEVRRQRGAYWEAASTPPDSPPPTILPAENTPPTPIHYPIQSPSPHWHQNWQSYVEYDAPVPHHSHGDYLHGRHQQYYSASVPSMDPTLNQANFPAGMDWHGCWFNRAPEEHPELI